MARQKRELTKMKIKRGLPQKWRKKYKGEMYYFRGDYEQALDLWKQKKTELENTPDYDDLPPLGEKDRERLRLIHPRNTEGEYEQVFLQERLDRWGYRKHLDALRLQADEADAIVAAHRQAVATDRTITAQIKEFLAQKKTQVAMGSLKPSSWDNIRCRLQWFEDWIGGVKPLDAINEAALVNFHAYLVGKATEGKISWDYVSNIMGDVNTFIDNRYELRLMERPRNLGSKALSISVHNKKIIVWTKDEYEDLLSVAPDRLKLALLLMMNCGMYQGDIAMLRHDEVDWEQGRITRKRSKGEKYENVPTVSYKLWKPTFNLLKKLRSNHPEIVLTNEDGNPLRSERLDEKDGKSKLKKSDNIKSEYFRLCRKLKIATKPLKQIRKTGASTLSNHKDYKFYAQYFLGQSPKTIAEKHYIIPSADEFDKAVAWLGQQFELTPTAKSGQSERSRTQ
jgi:integrase